MSNRTAAFPSVRADLPWVVPEFRKRSLPLQTAGFSSRFICYGEESWDDVRCGDVEVWSE